MTLINHYLKNNSILIRFWLKIIDHFNQKKIKIGLFFKIVDLSESKFVVRFTIGLKSPSKYVVVGFWILIAWAYLNVNINRHQIIFTLFKFSLLGWFLFTWMFVTHLLKLSPNCHLNFFCVFTFMHKHYIRKHKFSHKHQKFFQMASIFLLEG